MASEEFLKYLKEARLHLDLAEKAIQQIKGTPKHLVSYEVGLLRQLTQRTRQLRDDTIRAACRTHPKKEVATWFNMTAGRISQICSEGD